MKGFEAWTEKEQKMLDEHGSSLTFQVYRLDPQATTIAELQGEKLGELKVDSSFASKTDTVATVRDEVLALFEERSRTGQDPAAPAPLGIEEGDRVTLFFGGRPMQDDKRFYADHFMMLPVWVQVCLHRCEREALTEIIAKLSAAERGRPDNKP